jgi:hypothetical protein
MEIYSIYNPVVVLLQAAMSKGVRGKRERVVADWMAR